VTVGLVAFQAWLGKETVERELPAEISAVHLSVALTILALLALVTMTSLALKRSPLAAPKGAWFGRLAAAAASATLALMAIGSYVSGAGYGLACNGWPLCNGEVIPSASSVSVQMHFLHRFLALVLGLVLAGLVWTAFRDRSVTRADRTAAVAAMGLFALQALVGAANVWTQLATWAGASHLALGTGVFLLLVVVNIRVHRLYDMLGTRQAQAQPGLLGAPR
jgi:cytochrome c oxidase assembly protein subunit 15